MFNEAHVDLVGYVATEPSYQQVGSNKIPKLTMRVRWTTRRRDNGTGEWVDGNTSFVNVICWRKLAENLSTCLRKGDPVLVRGRLDVRSFTGRDGQRRIAVDVDANTLGHDLCRGVAGFRRVWESAGKTAEQAATDGGDGDVPAGDSPDLLAGTDLDGDAVIQPGEDIFDDSAIDALAQEADSVTAPF